MEIPLGEICGGLRPSGVSAWNDGPVGRCPCLLIASTNKKRGRAPTHEPKMICCAAEWLQYHRTEGYVSCLSPPIIVAPSPLAGTGTCLATSLGAVGRVSVPESPRHARSDRHVAPPWPPPSPLGCLLGWPSSPSSQRCSLGNGRTGSCPGTPKYCDLPSKCTSLPSFLANSIAPLAPPPQISHSCLLPPKQQPLPPQSLPLALHIAITPAPTHCCHTLNIVVLYPTPPLHPPTSPPSSTSSPSTCLHTITTPSPAPDPFGNAV